MEAHEVMALADALDGQGMADKVHSPVGIVGRGDDAGVGVQLQKLLADLRLTDDDAAHPQLQRPLDHIRLVTADHDAVRRGEQQILPAGGQGYRYLTGNFVPKLAALVDDLALQNGQQIEYRHILHTGIADSQHIVVGHVTGGEHTVQCSVLIAHGHNGNVVRLHHLPCPADGGGGGEGRGRIVHKVPHLCADVVNELRGLGVKLPQHGLRLVADLPQTGGAVLPLAQRVFQGGIGHGGHDRIRVGIAVAGNIYGIHTETPF